MAKLTDNLSYREFKVIVDGPIKVIDIDLYEIQLVACVVLENGILIQVTEKLFFKWILPELNKKEEFKTWFESSNLKYPSTKKDVLGGPKQNQVNRFILKLVKKYNSIDQ